MCKYSIGQRDNAESQLQSFRGMTTENEVEIAYTVPEGHQVIPIAFLSGGDADDPNDTLNFFNAGSTEVRFDSENQTVYRI